MTDRVMLALEELYVYEFGRNQAALAKALDVSPAAVSKLLGRKNEPSYDMADRIAQLKGVPVHELLGVEDLAVTSVSMSMRDTPAFAALAIKNPRATMIEKLIASLKEAVEVGDQEMARVAHRAIGDLLDANRSEAEQVKNNRNG